MNNIHCVQNLAIWYFHLKVRKIFFAVYMIIYPLQYNNYLKIQHNSYCSPKSIIQNRRSLKIGIGISFIKYFVHIFKPLILNSNIPCKVLLYIVGKPGPY